MEALIKILKSQLANCRSLSQEEQCNLFLLSKKGDLSARRVLEEANLKLVFSLVGKKYATCPNFLDMLQVGYEALHAALEKYDVEKGNFSTYLSRCINNKIVDDYRANGRLVFLPDNKIRVALKLAKAKSELLKCQETVSCDELAEYCGMECSEVERLLSLDSRNVDIDEVGEDGSPVGEWALYAGKMYLDDGLSKVEESNLVYELLDAGGVGYPARDSEIIIRYFRLDDGNCNTNEIAADYGITPERVRQIVRDYKRRMKEYVKTNHITWAA